MKTETARMTESDLRQIMAGAGWTWEIDAEISLLGADTIIAAMYGDGDLVNDAGWDENENEIVLNIAAARGFHVVGYADR